MTTTRDVPYHASTREREERDARLAMLEPVDLFRLTLDAGEAAGWWSGTADFARRIVARDERKMRRALRGEEPVPPPVLAKLKTLALTLQPERWETFFRQPTTTAAARRLRLR